jgi:RND family efflux transporter MFP subunit
LTIIALLTFCSPLHSLAQPVSKVVVERAALRQLPSTTALVGRVRPNRESTVGSSVSGLVSNVPVRNGDYVEAGALICQIDDQILRLAVEQAARELDSLGAALDVAKAQLDRWTQERDRMARLSGGNKAQAKELYETESEYNAAVASVREIEQRAAAQDAKRQQAVTLLKRARIIAPFAGYIRELHTEVAEWLPRGGPVADVIEVDKMLVRIDVPEGAIAAVTVGHAATVQLDALDRRIVAQVRHVLPQADDRAHTFPVDLELPNADRQIRAGMFARATVRISEPTENLAVPKDAIVEKNGTLWVWTVENNSGVQMATPTAITTGAEVDSWIAVTSPNITADLHVVIRGNERLMPFPSPVEIVHENALLDSTPPAAAHREMPVER